MIVEHSARIFVLIALLTLVIHPSLAVALAVAFLTAHLSAETYLKAKGSGDEERTDKRLRDLEERINTLAVSAGLKRL